MCSVRHSALGEVNVDLALVGPVVAHLAQTGATAGENHLWENAEKRRASERVSKLVGGWMDRQVYVWCICARGEVSVDLAPCQVRGTPFCPTRTHTHIHMRIYTHLHTHTHTRTHAQIHARTHTHK